MVKSWVAAAVVGVGSVVMGAERRPNFLFVYADDQRWDAMSCVQEEFGREGSGRVARFPWFKTPNMDRVAREGVRFRNAFVVNSLCAPSRSNFVTGQYSHLNGVVNNHTPAPGDRVTHASVLRGAGYTTAYFGKWHHQNQRERPGFDVVATFVGQGRFQDCPFVVDGKDTATKGWVDDVTTDYAVEFIKKQKGGAKPFDMVVGFKSPHGPRTPAERAKGRFAGEKFEEVPNLDAGTPFKAGNAAATRARRGMAAVEGHLNYFRCVSAIDDCLGRLLDALEENGLAEDTVVVYTSDNGYYFGEHGLGDKRSAYEESMRIPLVMRYPKMMKEKGRVIDEMVLNIDLAPTFVAMAGEKVPASMQGRSWVPLLEGKAAGWRTRFFYEYFFERGFASPTVTAVRTNDAKLVVYPGKPEWTELFDVKSDPYEMKNLFNDPGAKELRGRMEKEYEEEKRAVGFVIPEYADKPAAAGQPAGAD